LSCTSIIFYGTIDYMFRSYRAIIRPSIESSRYMLPVNDIRLEIISVGQVNTEVAGCLGVIIVAVEFINLNSPYICKKNIYKNIMMYPQLYSN
jgi:hypothetical protein